MSEWIVAIVQCLRAELAIRRMLRNGRKCRSDHVKGPPDENEVSRDDFFLNLIVKFDISLIFLLEGMPSGGTW